MSGFTYDGLQVAARGNRQAASVTRCKERGLLSGCPCRVDWSDGMNNVLPVCVVHSSANKLIEIEDLVSYEGRL